MSEEMKKYLYDIMSRIDGLHSIVITDRDGVPLLKVSDDEVPEVALKPSILSTVATVTDQGGKLGLGKNKWIMATYNNYQVIHFNKSSLMVSLIAAANANTGKLIFLT
ncbi:ragulator complex protein LAMTOR3-like [Centruroides sculpturatus]|uniref:ragulator complex protein LAMTOR3-like n=1 Tax=Centruroides sculpturatus TaxID=218467 RepID=UPI000C6E0C0C|nr:ragulator complex protein LAMTOR3-like [Centruroides sculpturatus]